MDYFDVHSHIQEKEFDADRDEVLVRMKEAHIGAFVIGTDIESSRRAVALARSHDNLYAIIGQHPTDRARETFVEEEYEKLLDEKVVGIGECGLDYFRLKGDFETEKTRQVALFKKQIEFALTHNLPLMLHCRPTRNSVDAYRDVLEILEGYKKEYEEKLRGDVHFFVGNREVAGRFVALNFTLSFTGVITFASEYDAVVRETPLTHILSETDCPFVAPVPYRSLRNEPLFVKEIVGRIAHLRDEDEEGVKKALLANVRRVFAL
ncbi:MAG: TatD family hydrolase [Candidatus Paceibacterota bacterium]